LETSCNEAANKACNSQVAREVLFRKSKKNIKLVVASHFTQRDFFRALAFNLRVVLVLLDRLLRESLLNYLVISLTIEANLRRLQR
jgi:hypothetical protein